jgi:aspartate aminotransferase-like enzyme
MERYSIPLVPGPVSVPAEILAAYQVDYGSPDLEDEFWALYQSCETGLQQLLGTRNSIAIQSGEGMVALWGALKSVIRPGERVLAVGTGVFGYGVGDMARAIGAEVEVVGFEYDQIVEPGRVRAAALRFRPKLITLIHCETPSGTLNPLPDIGAICREVDALYYVDFVASAGGVPVDVDAAQIDLGLLGSQKVLSLLTDLAMVSVSERAWQEIQAVHYAGYDALAPWQQGVAQRYLPYTHNWQAMAALQASLNRLAAEGPARVYRRHAAVAAHCRSRLQAMGVRLYPAQESANSPTVTAAYVPDGWTYTRLDGALRQHGMAVGGSYGPLAGKVFRIGHMGSQADLALVERGMDLLEKVINGEW